MSVRRSFTLNTEPHIAELGDVELRFKPEAYGSDIADAWSVLDAETHEATAALQAVDENTPARERSRLSSEAGRAGSRGLQKFIASFLVDEGEREKFLKLELPDRVFVELQQWLLEVYGLRPTGRASDSPAGQSTDETSTSSTSGP